MLVTKVSPFPVDTLPGVLRAQTCEEKNKQKPSTREARGRCVKRASGFTQLLTNRAMKATECKLRRQLRTTLESDDETRRERRGRVGRREVDELLHSGRLFYMLLYLVCVVYNKIHVNLRERNKDIMK